MTYYPVNLKLEGKRCLVVGGGAVAERKAASLLACSAEVTVISPKLTPALYALAEDNQLVYLAREFKPSDIADFFMVICATGDKTVNAEAAHEARRRGVLVNCVDDQELCDFFVPAQVQRGDLLFTVSTGGKSPAMTKILSDELAEKYGDEYGLYLEFMATMRQEIKSCLTSSKERELFWQTIMSQEIRSLLAKGNFRDAEARIRNAVSCVRSQS